MLGKRVSFCETGGAAPWIAWQDPDVAQAITMTSGYFKEKRDEQNNVLHV
jgi:hypothetical protein